MSLFYADNQKEEQMGQAYPYLQQPRTKPKRTEDTTFRRAEQQRMAAGEGMMRKSVLLKDEEGDEPGWCSRFCACTKLNYYKDYFNVTNKDVVKRMMMGLQFWSGGFFEPREQEYDFYGPFWIYTTIIFCLGAVHNIINYQVYEPFEYNFTVVGSAFGFMYIEGFGFPVLFTFLLKFLGAEIKHIQTICLYGYSMVPCIICLLFCSFNVCILHLVLLGYAMGSKAAFIIKNLNQGIPISSSKKVIAYGVIIGEVVLQFFVFRLAFIKCASAVTPSAPPKHFFTARHFQF